MCFTGGVSRSASSLSLWGAGTRIRGTNCPWSGRGRVHWEALGGGGASTGTLGEGENAYAVTCLLFFLPLATLSYLALTPIYNAWAIPLWQAGQALDQLASAEGLVLAVDYGEPSLLYYSRRKGWHFPEISFLYRQDPPDSQYVIHELESRRQEGARYLVLTQYAFWWFETYPEFRTYLDARYRRVRETEAYIIFELTGPSTEERR